MADFDRLWDFKQIPLTEERFRALLPATEGAVRLELLTQIARAQGLQRRFNEAHATLDEVAAQLTDDMALVRLRYLLERGRVQNSSGEASKSIPLFLEAWNLGQAAGEEDYAVDAAHMLGIVEPDPGAQLAWSLKALTVAEASTKARRWLGPLYNNIGWTYADMGQYEDALELFRRGVALREEQGQPGPIRMALYAYGHALRKLGRSEEAMAVQERAWESAQSTGEQAPYVREELGELLLAQGRAEEARPHFAAAYEGLSEDPWLVRHESDRLERLRELGGA